MTTPTENTLKCTGCGQRFFEVDVIARGWPRPRWWLTECDGCRGVGLRAVRYRRKFDPSSDDTKRKKELETMSPDDKAGEALYVLAAEVTAACNAFFIGRGMPLTAKWGEEFSYGKVLDET